MLTLKLKKVIKEYEKKNKKKVFRSKPHTWASEKRGQFIIQKFPSSIAFSKLLTSLSLGVTSRFMITEKDQELREWIKRQKYISVLPEDLFRKSLELQEGDIYKAILSIENVLSEYWKDKKRNTEAGSIFKEYH